jgi:hypothetical protein
MNFPMDCNPSATQYRAVGLRSLLECFSIYCVVLIHVHITKSSQSVFILSSWSLSFFWSLELPASPSSSG